jgi:argininosuccinate synthase
MAERMTKEINPVFSNRFQRERLALYGKTNIIAPPGIDQVYRKKIFLGIEPPIPTYIDIPLNKKNNASYDAGENRIHLTLEASHLSTVIRKAISSDKNPFERGGRIISNLL